MSADLALNSDELWQKFLAMDAKKRAVAMAGVAAVGAAVSSPVFATSSTGGSGAATSIANGVTDATNMINQVDNVSAAAFGVALAPLGFVLLLRILHMVLNRV